MPEGDGFNIDVQGAAAAIDEAGGLDAAFQAESGFGPTQTPDSQGTPAPTEPVTQEGQYRNEQGQFASRPEAEQTPADSSFMGENFDPASLPPELQPAYKQMQAHWTRTLQQAAPYRRLAEEYQIEDPAQLREVIQFHQDLQDPSSWKAIHQELGQLLEQQGLSPAQADAAATQALQQQAQSQDPMAAFAEDPEFQPIRSAFDSIRNDVQSLKAELEQAREAERQQQIQMAIQGEHQRQENIIRQSRPDWGDNDVESIYQLSVSMGGNLLDAAARYEAMQASWAERFVGQKESPNPVTAETVLPGAVSQQEQGGEAGRVPTLDEAHTALMAHLRSIGAAD